MDQQLHLKLNQPPWSCIDKQPWRMDEWMNASDQSEDLEMINALCKLDLYTLCFITNS